MGKLFQKHRRVPMSNHLKQESSPYLLQHAENPVNWYPWCEEAFTRAKYEDKPIFLSIGYSTCHWCHVMAHESFENPDTAEILNQNFICIKVDREERPDVDSVCMSVCQALTGSGGWPMSIFMTWDKKPFYAGTYFPVKSRLGMPGFRDLLNAIAEQWQKNRDKLLTSAEAIMAHVKPSDETASEADVETLIRQAVQTFHRSFDAKYGGFGAAPKFPTPHNLLFLLLYAKQNTDNSVLQMAEITLTQMRKGGICDQIGGGFSRYSTDRYFLAPHFEKMLYDNALLIMAYAAAYSMTKNPIYLNTAEQTAQYILREMTSPDGGFYSAQDADSEGVEGKYYTFTLEEILQVLGEEQGQGFAEYFDITSSGNFEGKNIPNLLKQAEVQHPFGDALKTLYDYRKNRTKLHLDDKILLSWNAMMIAALSMLFRVSQNTVYLDAAKKAQTFLEQNLSDGMQLFTSWRNGNHTDKAFLDDYAFYVVVLTELYHSTLDKSYLELAERFCEEAVRRFAAPDGNGFCMCGSTELFMNPKETHDGAIPSGNAVMAYNFVRLYQLTDKERYQTLAEKQLLFLATQAQDYPAGHCLFLLAALLYENPPTHITVVLKESSDLSEVLEKIPFLENVSVVTESEKYPLLNDHTTFYVCKNHSCLPPVNSLADKIDL